jgi:excisionase family DNA binding protein
MSIDPMAQPIENLLTIKDVAAICGVSVKTVRRWIAASELPAARLGNQWRIRPKDLQHFIQERLNW